MTAQTGHLWLCRLATYDRGDRVSRAVMSTTLLTTMPFTVNFLMAVCKTSVGLSGRMTFVTKLEGQTQNTGCPPTPAGRRQTWLVASSWRRSRSRRSRIMQAPLARPPLGSLLQPGDAAAAGASRANLLGWQAANSKIAPPQPERAGQTC